ncbi:hypothetical protein [Arthrobacter pigmenti]
MKAGVYRGPRDIEVADVPDAKIARPTDVLVRITATNICGSDLHMYEGRTDFETGRTLRTLAAEAGAHAPEQLASSVMLLVDGVICARLATHDPNPGQRARHPATILITEATT